MAEDDRSSLLPYFTTILPAMSVELFRDEALPRIAGTLE
jgi:hypothetical protein